LGQQRHVSASNACCRRRIPVDRRTAYPPSLYRMTLKYESVQRQVRFIVNFVTNRHGITAADNTVGEFAIRGPTHRPSDNNDNNDCGHECQSLQERGARNLQTCWAEPNVPRHLVGYRLAENG